jgi:hypothetical protein
VKRMWPVLRRGYENLLSTGRGEEKCSTGGRTRMKLQILYSCPRRFPPKSCTYFMFLTCSAHRKHLALRHTTQQNSVSITTAANPPTDYLFMATGRYYCRHIALLCASSHHRTKRTICELSSTLFVSAV